MNHLYSSSWRACHPPTMVMLLKSSRPILAVYIIITATTLTVKADDYLCETIDCVNGMFNQAACTCECIAPFCADVYGNCIVSGTCDNPWEACEKGVNCPWWKHTSNAESCETGPLVSSNHLIPHHLLILNSIHITDLFTLS